ncbi:hypothetical protein LVJ83_04975 [Uruburuella testudinis]|uniref:Uncharacterized protein n=1 Tax=Uruburuella testudinis TaxID=1282863 RepID=A0ABY4E1I0_9NEIS|nr:hypothetical protein [Uruburuella testudinis]UOO82821.1 hypothetical protein LVJ83_04975 [Uruburuella testudinis]
MEFGSIVHANHVARYADVGAAAVGLASSSDHLITGLSNFGKKASEQKPTITVQGLKQLGLSEQAANYV